MSTYIRCNVCGNAVDEEADAAQNWWNIACWKRKAQFKQLQNGRTPVNPDDAFGKDVCPNCMPGLQGALSSAGRRP